MDICFLEELFSRYGNILDYAIISTTVSLIILNFRELIAIKDSIYQIIRI